MAHGEFALSRAERVALRALAEKQAAMNAEAEAVMNEARARLGIDPGERAEFDIPNGMVRVKAVAS